MLILQLLRQKYSVAAEQFSTCLAVKGLTLHCRAAFSNHLGTGHISRLMQSHSKISALGTPPHAWLPSLLPGLSQVLSSPSSCDRCAACPSLASLYESWPVPAFMAAEYHHVQEGEQYWESVTRSGSLFYQRWG